MKGKRLVIGAVLVALVAGGLVIALSKRGGGGKKRVQKAVEPKTPAPRASRSSKPSPAGAMHDVMVTADDDPAGDLRLEGQVLGAGDAPVGGAIVTLSSRPPRTATTAADGSFAFDKLIPRRYSLRARAGEHIGGPIVYNLTSTSDPAVIRMRKGARLTVTVADRDRGHPIRGASVSIASVPDHKSTTDESGVASLAGIGPGGSLIVVEASGYATRYQPIRVPFSPGVHLRQRIELTIGLDVSGRVVDEKGKPIAGARVMQTNDVAALLRVDPKRAGAKTDDKGRFTVRAVAPGRTRLLAIHPDYAPASSAPITITRISAPTNVEIRLKAGGVIAGRVLDAAGSPQAHAEVMISTTPDEGGWNGGARRSAIADAEGNFEVKGLHRTVLHAHARTPEASSELVAVDLRARQKKSGVELRLTITTAISGRVVDEAGEPIAEAQVVAEPDFWKGGARIDDMFARGPSFATTDGGGNFRITGLPAGDYLLHASRTDLSGLQQAGKGVAAKAGATGVEIVLPREGGIKGTIVTSKGEAPALATVSITWAAGVPATKGAFTIDGVPPGTYDVTVRGLDFPDKIVKDVKVEPGKVTDMGKITVARGRVVTGVVRSAGGSPVSGAEVVIGVQLVSDDSGLTAGIDDASKRQMGIRTTVTGDDGAFALRGVGAREMVIASEHRDHGRSRPVMVRPGDADVKIDLVLVALGVVAGKVTKNGAPAPSATVILGDTGGAKQLLVTQTGSDGAFEIGRVPEGTHKLTAMIGSGPSAVMKGTEVVVAAGKTVRVAVDITTGSITMQVAVKGKDGAHIDGAQVFVFEGKVDVKTGGELNKLFLTASSAGGAKMSFALGGKPAEFKKVEPGDYSLCVVPINGDMNDPQFTQRLQRNVETLAVYCQAAKVATTPETQTIEAVVPPMSPLPE